MLHLSYDKFALIHTIIRTLHERTGQHRIYPPDDVDWKAAAGVLLPLGQKFDKTDVSGEPCIIFNKRSLKVRQPGDLCFPGGSMAPRLDPCIARLLSLPITPLGRWRYWADWKKNRPSEAKLMSIFWATSLRESFEEMRLNPFGVKFLGPLPPQSLVMFQRTIYPMAAWIDRQKRFFPNWEVTKIVYIPIKDLLNKTYYGRYRLRIESNSNLGLSNSTRDFPCFRFQSDDEVEILWGATYRITTLFLEYVFDFRPPVFEELPVIKGILDENYLTGQS